MNYCGQRVDHSRLFAEMAAITPPILVCIFFCNVIAFPLIKRWHLFSHPLSLSWPCGLLKPLECAKSGVVYILEPRACEVLQLLPSPSWNAALKNPDLAHWRMRVHML